MTVNNDVINNKNSSGAMYRMHNEGKTDNRKTMIMFSSADFSTPSENQICE